MFKDCRSLDINENIIKSKKGKEDVKNAKNKYGFNFFEYLIKKEIENINIQKQVLTFVPKGFKGFDKSKMKTIAKNAIKKIILINKKKGPIILDDEKSEKSGANIIIEKIKKIKKNEENIKIEEIVKKETPKKS